MGNERSRDHPLPIVPVAVADGATTGAVGSAGLSSTGADELEELADGVSDGTGCEGLAVGSSVVIPWLGRGD